MLQLEKDTSKWKCEDCGCTDTTPCLDGCAWVRKDLCSSCNKIRHRRHEKTEFEMRKVLYHYGIGLYIIQKESGEIIINAYPTRYYDFETRQGIYKIQLFLNVPLYRVPLDELLKHHLLRIDDYSDWNRGQWEPWL